MSGAQQTVLDVLKQALEALTCSGEPDDPGHRCGHCDDYVDRNSVVREALRAQIERVPSEPVQQWIPVKERMPKTAESVWIHLSTGVVVEGFRFHGTTWEWEETGNWNDAEARVLHWMPMEQRPAPPAA